MVTSPFQMSLFTASLAANWYRGRGTQLDALIVRVCRQRVGRRGDATACRS